MKSIATAFSALVFTCAAVGGDVVFTKGGQTFGGVGFQNAEANLTALMPDDFRDQRVLKTFREVGPTFSRVYAGFADQSKAQADRFADYYDATFRRAGTELYAVGGMMPFVPEDETDAYAEKVAANLEYLIHKRGCTGIRKYCMTNELGINEGSAFYAQRMDRFKAIHTALRRAFDRHGLQGVDLAATDVNGHVDFSLKQLDWATKNMDAITGIYCTHWYMFMGNGGQGLVVPSSPQNAFTIENHFTKLVAKAEEKGKRYFVGEIGLWTPSKQGDRRVMHDDTGYPLREPGLAAEAAMLLAEIALTAMNCGAYGALSWSFADYPDPFVFEDGDTPKDKVRYESAKCAYWPDRKYNKWGLFRWDSVDLDYRSYPSLYTMGYMAKLFRGSSRILKRTVYDDTIRAGGAVNPDRSVSIAIINWGATKNVSVVLSDISVTQPFRVYEYDSAKPPFNDFNDLQPVKEMVMAREGKLEVVVPARSVIFLTTDYVDRVPSKVDAVVLKDGKLSWNASKDSEHVYYRVYRNGRQVSSTVATELQLSSTVSDSGTLTVRSVDRWGNEGRPN